MELSEIYASGLSYPNYRNHIEALVAEGKTTGDTQTPQLLEFTKLNVQRMNRLDKTLMLSENALTHLEQQKNSYRFLLLGDAWCGDCAQIIPVIQKIVAHAQGKIDLRIVSRDAYPAFMESYLGGGAKSIPKILIFKQESWIPMHIWGPRPKHAQEIMLHWKANPNTITWDAFERELHLWYTKDKGVSIVEELIHILATP